MFRVLKFMAQAEYVLKTASKATLKFGMMMSTVIFMSGVAFTNLLWDCQDPAVSSMFGNLNRSMWSLFQIMTLDNWVAKTDLIIEERPAIWVFFLMFVFCASICLISLVPAIFIELHIDAQQREAKAKA